MDSANNLAALVSNDAEFDHFEAIREEYEPALTDFVASAAKDEMASLTEMSTKLPGRRTGTFAFVGATVIDVTGKPPIRNATVVTSGGKITAVGPSAEVKVPADAQRIEVAGKYIIPGLWDMHAHYEQVEWGPIYLGTGVTTARDVGNEMDFTAALRRVLDAGDGVGPRLLLAGVVDGRSPGALGIQQAATPAEGVAFVDRYHAAGFQQIKIYSSMSLPVLTAVARRAHALGMTVTGHVPEEMDPLVAVDSGLDQINHVQYPWALLRRRVTAPNGDTAWIFAPDSSWARAALVHLVERRTVVDPTMALFEWLFRDGGQPAEATEPGIAHVAPELQAALRHMGMPADRVAIGRQYRAEFMATLAALHRAGVPLVAGTDQAVPGYSLHRELELYVEAGLTPMEAIQSATSVPARVMGLDGDVGTLTAGKRADLLVVDGDPLADIANTRRIALVVANGRRYEPGVLLRSVGFLP
jgi:cytosine/adenosine deaminase-related metal-dependent hydrolase